MNIIVKTANGHIIVRPDTTWEKDNEDFFAPEFVEEVSWTPVVFARVLKPGRSVGLRFASRYYDAVGYGLLLYPENMIVDSPESFATACCLDHTSFLPAPFFNPVTLSLDGNIFTLLQDGRQIFRTGSKKIEIIEEALVEATRMIYIRTGDLIAIELSDRQPLLARSASDSASSSVAASAASSASASASAGTSPGGFPGSYTSDVPSPVGTLIDKTRVTGTFCDKNILDFNVIF